MRGKPIADWTMDELKDILERVRQALGERDYTVMNAVVETLDYLTHLAKDKQAAEIYRILVGSRSEKTRDVLRVLDLEREAKEAAAAEEQSEHSASAAEPNVDATHQRVLKRRRRRRPMEVGKSSGAVRRNAKDTAAMEPMTTREPAGFRCI
jgi:hypothetical protein